MPLTNFEIRDMVAVITLNRPDKLNSFNREMSLEVQQHLDTCKENPDVRCVYLTGAGNAFSAGQDLEEVTGPNAIEAYNILREHYNPIIRRIRKLDRPVVSAVNGVAAGAAANIAICCDVVLASSAASFIQAFSKIGLIPDSGGTFFLPRLIGLQKSLALCMLGDKVSAEEAERMGMVYKVIPEEKFAAESFAIAQKLAQMPTKALHLTKKALNQAFISSMEEQLHDEELLQQQASGTEDYKEGVQAFLEKRKPVFKGK